MIQLTQVLWPEKDSVKFREQKVYVAEEQIMYMTPNRMKLSAPPTWVCNVFRGEIPKKYYKEIGAINVTTIYFSDGKEIDVNETMDEIKKIIEDGNESSNQ